MNNEQFDREQSRHDSRLPPEQVEPTEAQFDTAFTNLLNNVELVERHVEDFVPSLSGLLSVYNDLGLPSYSYNDANDALRDKYEILLTKLVTDYREWLVDTGALAEEAEKVREQELADQVDEGGC